MWLWPSRLPTYLGPASRGSGAPRVGLARRSLRETSSWQLALLALPGLIGSGRCSLAAEAGSQAGSGWGGRSRGCPPAVWAPAQHLSPALCPRLVDLPAAGSVTQVHQTPSWALCLLSGMGTVQISVPGQCCSQIGSLCLSFPFHHPYCAPQGGLPDLLSSYSLCSSHTGLLVVLPVLWAQSCPRAFARLCPLPETSFP